MVVSEEGKSIWAREVQWKNASSPIEAKEDDENSTETREVQFEKARFPNDATEEGIAIDKRELQPSNIF